MALISVIIPVYNVENYLRECLDSICNQTFEDIEVICIDDGSTDSSLEILKEYQNKDKRFRIFENDHEGPSGARNTGLDNAEGKYIYCMDSDDIIELDAFEKLYNLSEEKSLDMVIFKLINFDDETKEKYPTAYYDMEYLSESVKDEVFSYSDIREHVYEVPVSLPGKFFKSEILSDIRFVEGIIFEDNPFFVEVLFNCQRIYFLDEYLYNRRVRQKSITTSNKNFTDFIVVCDMLVDITKKYGHYYEYREFLYPKILKNMYLRCLQVEEENRQYYFDKMKENLQSKKEEYDNDEVFQNIDERVREIYYKCLESDTARELELSMDLFDLNVKLNRIIKEKNQINRERLKLFNRSHELSLKLNELANENRELKNS